MNFFAAYSHILEHGKDLSQSEKSVLTVLCYRAGIKASCWPSLESIGHDAGMSGRTVSRAMQGLVDGGWVAVSGTQRRQEYVLWYSDNYGQIVMQGGQNVRKGGQNDVITGQFVTIQKHEVTNEDNLSVNEDNLSPDCGQIVHLTIKENNNKNQTMYQSSVDNNSHVRESDLPSTTTHVQPLDEWVTDEFARFGYSLPIPVAQNIATRTLHAMNRTYGEEYITDRLSELTGQPQVKVVRYIIQDGPDWIKRRLNPPPVREAKYSKPKKERVIDHGVRTYVPQVEDDFWAFSPEEVAANKARTAARLAAEANQEVK